MEVGEVHGAFILAMSAAGIINWRLNEILLGETHQREQHAEKSDLIDGIGAWVLETACLQMRAWQLDHCHRQPLSLSVNVAPRQLRDPAIVDVVTRTLDRSGLTPGCLVLEITESAMMQDTELTLERLTALRALGLRLAVDDFGTGHSSLSYLQQFPIDIVKIDRSFVARIDQGAEESALARAIVRLAHTRDSAPVVDPLLVEAGFAFGEAAGDGLAGDLAGPLVVGPMSTSLYQSRTQTNLATQDESRLMSNQAHVTRVAARAEYGLR